MKRLLLIPIILSLGVLSKNCVIPNGITVVYAQSLPATVHTVWNPSIVDADHGAPLYYTVSTDGNVVQVPLSACNSTQCSVITTVTAYGQHSTVVSAVNQKISTDPTSIQSSDAAAFAWALLQPSNKPGNVGVKQ